MVQYQLVCNGVGSEAVYTAESLLEVRQIATKLASCFEEMGCLLGVDCFQLFEIKELDNNLLFNEEVNK